MVGAGRSVSRPRFANAGTRSAYAATASAAASSYAAANSVDVESSPAIAAQESSLPTSETYWSAATWFALANASAAVSYPARSMTSRMSTSRE